MCTVGKNIKLCTCEASLNKEAKNHYWTLSRYNATLIESNKEIIFGMHMIPMDMHITPEKHRQNKQRITRTLNSGKAFDKPMRHTEGDLLSLFFKFDAGYDEVIYDFSYKNERWRSVKSDEWERFLYSNDNKMNKEGWIDNG